MCDISRRPFLFWRVQHEQYRRNCTRHGNDHGKCGHTYVREKAASAGPQRHHRPAQGAAAAVLPRLFRGPAADGPSGRELCRAAAGAHRNGDDGPDRPGSAGRRDGSGRPDHRVHHGGAAPHPADAADGHRGHVRRRPRRRQQGGDHLCLPRPVRHLRLSHRSRAVPAPRAHDPADHVGVRPQPHRHRHPPRRSDRSLVLH